MGLFDKLKKEPTGEELVYMEENKKRLEEEFDVTRAMGVKKHPTAMQFIYDKGRRCFVVVEGPEESFKEKNPYVVDFDQVRDVYVEVDEYWTETKDKFAPPDRRMLLMEDYGKVYWRYDIYMVIETDHPFAKTIKYQMNYRTITVKIPEGKVFVQRGLELTGALRDEEIKRAAERMGELADKQEKTVDRKKAIDILTTKRSENSILENAVGDIVEDVYVKRIRNISKHLERADKIRKILLER